MKKLFMLIVMAFNVLFISQIKAELFDGSIHFYMKRGESLTANTEIKVYYFCDYKENIGQIVAKKSVVTQNLQNDDSYYSVANNRSWGWFSRNYKYQPDLSTYSRDVLGGKYYSTALYTGPWYPGCPTEVSVQTNYCYYWGFANDKSSFIMWKEDLDGNITEKIYYMEVSIEDLMPKTVNHDFLYD